MHSARLGGRARPSPASQLSTPVTPASSSKGSQRLRGTSSGASTARGRFYTKPFETQTPVERPGSQSKPGTAQGSKPGTAQGSKPGTAQGSKTGTGQGSKPGTGNGSRQAAAFDTTPDEVLRVLAAQLSEAVVGYFGKKGVHLSQSESWLRFFGESDNGTGRITFDELENAIRTRLKINAARYSMLVLWRRLDTDSSGEVSIDEFAVFMYRFDLLTWPDASQQERERYVHQLNSAAEKWYLASGNWYRIFQCIDSKSTGHITFEELKRALRSGSGGFRLTIADISDEAIQKFWKAIDAEREMRVKLQGFMTFMRRNANGIAMTKVTEYSKMKRGTLELKRDILAEIREAPELTREELRAVATELAGLSTKWFLQRGMHSGSAWAQASPSIWGKLFDFIEVNGGRMTFSALENCMQNVLKATIAPDRLKALWRVVDVDGSSESSREEFVVALYRLQLETWPKPNESQLAELVAVLNAAADKWHRCSGNWYKVLNKLDKDGSGQLDFDEFVEVVRKGFPGFSLSPTDFSDEDIRGFWSAMDDDLSGLVTVKEFMVFMRKHGQSHSFHRLTEYSKSKRGAEEETKEHIQPQKRSQEELHSTKRLLDTKLWNYFSQRGIRCRMSEGWDRFWQEADSDRAGNLAFQKFARALRQRFLHLPGQEDTGMNENSSQELVAKGVSVEDVRALWAEVDADGSGMISAKEWWLGTYRIELKSWPEPKEQKVQAAVEIIKAKAEKIHQSKDNWYRFFKIVDPADSGNIDFDGFQDSVRRPMPCLALSAKVVSDSQLKMLWKALDSDRSGLIDKGEFMVFMRRHQRLRDAKPPPRHPEAEAAVARELIAEALVKYSADSLTEALLTLGLGSSWTGTITDWDWQFIARELLKFDEEQISDDALLRVFAGLDRNGMGELEIHRILERLSMQSQQLATSGSSHNMSELLRPRTATSESTRPSTAVAGNASLLPPVRSGQPTGSVPSTAPAAVTEEDNGTALPSLGTAEMKPQTAPISRTPRTLQDHFPGNANAAFGSTASLLSATSAQDQDAPLRIIAERLSEALLSFYQQRGFFSSVAACWLKFFAEMDADGSGRATFEELERTVQHHLRSARVSRYELLMLWRRIDADGSGEVSLDEFVILMYRMELAMWPDGSSEDIKRIVDCLSASAGKWHRASGNWYKVFSLADPQGQGKITFDDLKTFVRGTFPGLNIEKTDISDEDLFKLWKALDITMKMRVAKSDFMTFMRRHGGSMHRLTEYSMKKRGTFEVPQSVGEELAAAPHLSRDALRAVSARLAMMLQTWLKEQGVKCNSINSPSVWTQLFECVDSDGSGRMTFVEFKAAVQDMMREKTQLSLDELRALWRTVDVDSSGEATASEFAMELYRLQLEVWPRIKGEDFPRLVAVLNAAAEKWHRAGGNWYKVLTVCDEDKSGRLEFEEFCRVVRKSFPGLSLSPTDIKDDELRGIWRSMDEDRSGWVSIKEFMVWMRNHGKDFSMHRLTQYSLKKRGLIPDAAKEKPLPARSPEELLQCKRHLETALANYLAKKGVRCRVKESWQRMWLTADLDRSGRLTLMEIEGFMRSKMLKLPPSSSKASLQTLQDSNVSTELPTERSQMTDISKVEPQDLIVKGVTHEDMRVLFALADQDGSGEVSASEWALSLYHLDLDSWPDAHDEDLPNAVECINAAAMKYYQAQDNWYKVFRVVDMNDAGRMDFETFSDMVRRPLPCLSVATSQVSERQLKALWKAMDIDRSSEITVQEFMVYMRRCTKQKMLMSEPPKRAPVAEATTARQLLVQGLSGYSVGTLQAAYESWGMPWTGYISEWEWQLIARRLLGYTEATVGDSALHAVWASLDQQMVGQIVAEDLLLGLTTGKLPEKEAPTSGLELTEFGYFGLKESYPGSQEPMPAVMRTVPRRELLQELTYWRSAWWTSHLRPGGKTSALHLPQVQRSRAKTSG
mmetsp:Transcript_44544/g.80042  ORF Transcript_44544/g.80042 Transcript_44544/m.80042 type:complete len:1940 (+) Transcript_44544:73-5892(+)